MRQVVEMTGMSRQAIHFYIQKGLVPKPIKLGKTSAVYTDEHVQRILEVRRMREEQFLPLDAIRASLDERDEGYTPAQRRLITAVRSQFSSRTPPRGQRAMRSATAVARKAGVPRDDIEALVDAGLLARHEDARGNLRIAREDVWLVELWGELRSRGFGSDSGFTPADVAIYARHLDALVREEVVLVTERLANLPAERLSARIEGVLPVVGALLAGLHERAIRRFLAELVVDGD